MNFKLGVLGQGYNPRTQEAEAGELGVGDQLSYLGPVSNNNNKKNPYSTDSGDHNV
jgi:hypothetical protein